MTRRILIAAAAAGILPVAAVAVAVTLIPSDRMAVALSTRAEARPGLPLHTGAGRAPCSFLLGEGGQRHEGTATTPEEQVAALHSSTFTRSLTLDSGGSELIARLHNGGG